MLSAVVLAAGAGTRFGGTKQLHVAGGKPLVQHAVDAAAEAGVDEVVVVGHDAERVRAALRLPPGGRVVENPRYAEGMATSLAAGLDACHPSSEGAVVLLADQPGVTAEHLRSLAGAFGRSGAWIVRLRFRDGPGLALLSRAAWDEARALRGDVGARELMARRPDLVEEVAVDADAPPRRGHARRPGGPSVTGPVLTDEERAMLEGERGPAPRTAMRILLEAARAMDAPRFVEISSAHVDGCLYHGRAGLDFAERLVEEGATVAVPTTLNVGGLDLLHPELVRSDPETSAAARRLMELHVEMGCRPTWTCAPYQLPEARPGFGVQVAWAESNAIVFANSVLGARTERYGDFIDICAAIAGRAPFVGLHTDAGRRAGIVFRVEAVPDRLLDEDACYPVLGHLVGRVSGTRVPAIVGLPPSTSEDRLKALGAAAASSGAVAMFHAVGVTPEAPTLASATGGRAVPEVAVTAEDLRRARDELTTTDRSDLAAVAVGTPHASAEELDRLARLLARARVVPGVEFYAHTSRAVLREAERSGTARALAAAGVQVVTDTCTYLAPIIRNRDGAVMTDSAKWAWYAPGNLGLDVVFGSLEECVRSALLGRVWRDGSLWD